MMKKQKQSKQDPAFTRRVRRGGNVAANGFSAIMSTIIVTVSLFPLFWMVLSIFKTKRQVSAGIFWPTTLNLDAFLQLADTNFFNSLLVTFVGALISVTLCVIINLLAAYAFARLEFRGKKLLWVLVLLPMFVPGMTILVPLFLVCSKLGILDTMMVLIIPGVAQASHIFFMRQFFLNLPMSLEEAAKIDGANTVQIFTHLFLPLSIGPTIIVAINAFMGYWNAYLWPVLVVERESLQQIMQVIYSFKPSHDPNWPLIMLASAIATMIPLTIYLIFNKQIVESLKISGIK